MEKKRDVVIKNRTFCTRISNQGGVMWWGRELEGLDEALSAIYPVHVKRIAGRSNAD